MLLSFSFNNLKSFKNKAEFSMEPFTNNGSIDNAIETGCKKKPYVYRTSAIFGANASGKSNFIHAINYLRSLIESSYLKKLNEPMGIPTYKLGSTKENSTFEIEFIKNNNLYKYLVELNEQGIIREEAYYTELEQDKREKCLFKRTENDFVSPYGIDKEIAKQTISSRSLISELVNNRNTKDKFILEIYKWFSDDMTVILNYERPNLNVDLSHKDIDCAGKADFLRKADIPIMRLFASREGLFSIHKNETGEDITFNFMEEESEGTIALLALSDKIIPVLQGGKVLFIDELDNSLHPHLVKYLVNLFNNPETNPKNAQLIFTSHAHYLMDGDTLTRDQIWFVSKDNGSSSDLYSLSDFKEIKRKKGAFYNEYMYGIFGAVPKIGEE
jgi:hypothetical protein